MNAPPLPTLMQPQETSSTVSSATQLVLETRTLKTPPDVSLARLPAPFLIYSLGAAITAETNMRTVLIVIPTTVLNVIPATSSTTIINV